MSLTGHKVNLPGSADLLETGNGVEDNSRSEKRGASRLVEAPPCKTLVERSELHCSKFNPGWPNSGSPLHQLLRCLPVLRI